MERGFSYLGVNGDREAWLELASGLAYVKQQLRGWGGELVVSSFGVLFRKSCLWVVCLL